MIRGEPLEYGSSYVRIDIMDSGTIVAVLDGAFRIRDIEDILERMRREESREPEDD